MDFRLLACWSCAIMEPYFSKIALSLRFLFIATAAFHSRPNLWSGRIQGHEWLRKPSDLSFAIFLPQQSMNDAHGEVDKARKTFKLQCTRKGDKSRACVALSIFWSEMVFQNITLHGHFKSFQLFGDRVKWCQHLSAAIQHQLGGRDLVRADATNSATQSFKVIKMQRSFLVDDRVLVFTEAGSSRVLLNGRWLCWWF